MTGRLLLPSYGGGFYVWTACLLFFQGVLFLGYLYSHLIAPRIRRWHLLVVLVPITQLPLSVDPRIGQNVIWDITVTLFSSVALLFGLLATTSVTTQVWLTRAAPEEDPYPLYAASNAGSLLALVSYPFLWEPLFGLSWQKSIWSAGYLLYALTTFASYPWSERAWATEDEDGEEKASARDIVVWLLLSGAASAFSMAVTNVVTLEIGSAPFIWVLLLGIYLATFILAFQGRYPGLLLRLFPYVTGGALFFFYVRTGMFWGNLFAQLLAVFWVCFTAHAELYAQRPSARLLTTFYLLVSLGGWLGGVFVALVSPLVFTSFAEYPISLLLVAVTLLFLHAQEARTWVTSSWVVGRVALLLFTAVLALSVGRFFMLIRTDRTTIEVLRNPYGVYWVFESRYKGTKAEEIPGAVVRTLMHGTTVHGSERVDGPGGGEPTSYYHRSTPIGQLFASMPHPNRTAVIGLGTGAVAPYSTSQDEMTFYELDPDDVTIAREHFSYLRRAPWVRTVTGDARLELQKDPESEDGSLDLIFVDAFTSDAIPAHLLTREALELYLRKLKPDGLLLIHISNRYYDLRPVLHATGNTLSLAGAYVRTKPRERLAPLEDACTAYALTRDPARLSPLLQNGWQPATREALGETDPWTDDYVNILAPLLKKLRPTR